MKRAFASLLILMLAGCVESREAPAVKAIATRRPGAQIAELQRGRGVFVTRCIECHSLPAIREHLRSGWPKIVRWMAPRAGLTADEQQALTAYILAVYDAQ